MCKNRVQCAKALGDDAHQQVGAVSRVTIAGFASDSADSCFGSLRQVPAVFLQEHSMPRSNCSRTMCRKGPTYFWNDERVRCRRAPAATSVACTLRCGRAAAAAGLPDGRMADFLIKPYVSSESRESTLGTTFAQVACVGHPHLRSEGHFQHASACPTSAGKGSGNASDAMRPSPPATPLPWKPCCQITGLRPIPSIGLSSEKKNPVKPRSVAAGGGLLAVLPLPNRRC